MASDPTMEQLLRAAPATGGRTEDRLAALERRMLKIMLGETIVGRVESNGALMAGTGFTPTRLGVGIYRLTFARAWKPYPFVTAMAGREVGVTVFKQRDGTTPTETVFELQAHDAQTGNIWDCDFWFIAGHL